ncbi:hypothetical protein LJB99_05975 [Deltaproteobacteria bacterium OttesenSCG-928-K17]|nr:hypothetical protein [Deltaproteobacteria bacterium OttesenSCG-928-K17]
MNFNMKKILASKKSKVALYIAFAVMVLLALSAAILYPKYVQNSRNEAAKLLLEQIALAEMAIECGCCYCKCNFGGPVYIHTDDVDKTAEEAVMELAKWGSGWGSSEPHPYDFNPDPSFVFHIMRPLGVNDYGEPLRGFIVFAAHNSAGSHVYVYENIAGEGIKEVHENGVYNGGITAADFKDGLFSYEYDHSGPELSVKKSAKPAQIAPDPKDASPRRMIVVVPAE